MEKNLDMQQFAMDKDKAAQQALSNKIVGEIGYGTLIITGKEKEENYKRLQPVDTKITLEKAGRNYTINNPDCYAKEVLYENSDRPHYYIRVNEHGDVANPWDACRSHYKTGELDRIRGRESWEFAPVDKRCFDNYCEFLKTKNGSYLRYVERIIKNG